jgi:hypothetical protein
MNDKTIINADDNVKNIDLVGKYLLNSSTSGRGVDPLTCAMLAQILVDCRLYSTVRDRDIISPDLNQNFLAIVAVMEQMEERKEQKEQHDNSVESVAQHIIDDLRNSGIIL